MKNTGIGVLLDLDETLVLSSSIEAFRRTRQWSKCYAEFARTRLPEGTQEFIRHVRELAACGVVTTAPRAYAKRLLAFHSLDLDVLVAYHDVSARKPNPEPLLVGAKKLGIPIGRCVHVGDNETDELAAQRAGARSLTVCWTANGKKQALCRWSDVLHEIGKFKRDNQ